MDVKIVFLMMVQFINAVETMSPTGVTGMRRGMSSVVRELRTGTVAERRAIFGTCIEKI